MNIGLTSSRYGFLLALVAVFCTALSAGIYHMTSHKIQAAMEAEQRRLLLEVIPQEYFDNNLLTAATTPTAPQLNGIHRVYFAAKAGKLSAYAYETTAPDGYSGNIRLLVGLTPAGEVLGVRVIEHHETPGLGDKIEKRISDWILSFNHQFIRADNLSDWAVKKDGGKFDQFSGATITPRAVVNQVKRSALRLLENRALLQCGDCDKKE